MGKKTVHLVGLAAFLNQSQMICLKFRPVFFFFSSWENSSTTILHKEYFSIYIYIFFN